MKTNNYLIIILAFFIQCRGQKQVIKSAIYDNGLVEVIIHNDSISGVLSVTDEVDCRLLFYGKVTEGETIPVTILNTADLTDNKGTITITGENIVLKSNSIIFPCQRVIDLSSGALFSFTKEITLPNYRYDVVLVEKSFLYSAPEKLTAKKSYLIQGDIVKVLDKEGQWVKINFNSKIYWINSKDLKYN